MIPDKYHVFLLLTGFCRFTPQQVWGIVLFLPFLIASVTCGGMGGGDIKLVGACGFVLGFWHGFLAVLIGLSLLLFYFLIYQIVQKVKGKAVQSAFPLAPFLSIGCAVAYTFCVIL